jgi:hypothetical protein
MLPGRRDNAIKNYWNSRTFQQKMKDMANGVLPPAPALSAPLTNGPPPPAAATAAAITVATAAVSAATATAAAAATTTTPTTTTTATTTASTAPVSASTAATTEEPARKSRVTKSGRVSKPRRRAVEESDKENTKPATGPASQTNAGDLDADAAASACTESQASGSKEAGHYKGDSVIAASDGAWYEGKILKVQKDRKDAPFYVHYNGWDDKWDEWLTDQQLMKFPRINLLGGKLRVVEPTVKLSALKQPTEANGVFVTACPLPFRHYDRAATRLTFVLCPRSPDHHGQLSHQPLRFRGAQAADVVQGTGVGPPAGVHPPPPPTTAAPWST